MSVVAIDVGQTGARAIRAGKSDGPMVRTKGFATWLTGPRAVDSVADRICRIIDRTGSSEGVDSVLIGLSGFDHGGLHAQDLARRIGERTASASVIVASDAAAWYLGAFDQKPGVVAAVGTGSVVLAADGKGRLHRVDGWGHLLGDDGSAFAIGRAGLASALRQLDGREGSSRLLEQVVRTHGSAAALTTSVYRARRPASLIADFAKLVAESARAGDAQAVSIIEEAASALGRSIIAAFRSVFALGQPVPIRVTGAMTGAGEMYLEATRDAICKGLGQRSIDLDMLVADPLQGVRRLQPRMKSFFPGLVVEWHRR